MADPTDVKALVAEVADSNFSDERLNRRLEIVLSALTEDPSLSLPRAFDSAGLEAAYRFFSNQRVTAADILSSHFEATRKRCEDEGDFLSVRRCSRGAGAYLSPERQIESDVFCARVARDFSERHTTTAGCRSIQ